MLLATTLAAITVEMLPPEADPVTLPVKVIVGRSLASKDLKAEPLLPFAAKTCALVAAPEPMSVP